MDFIAFCLLHLRGNVTRAHPLIEADVKHHVVGHWGCVPGITRLLASLAGASSRADMTPKVVVGTGHAGAAWLAWLYYAGALTERGYPRTVAGLTSLCCDYGTKLSTEISPSWPGVLWAGGALGHAVGVGQGLCVGDEPVAVIVGDGEFETGPTLASLLAPIESRSKMPLVLVNLNYQRMTGPSLLSHMDTDTRAAFVSSFGWTVAHVDASDSRQLEAMIRTAFAGGRSSMIFQSSEKGLGAPPLTDGTPVVGTPLVHKAPLRRPRTADDLSWIDGWLKSYDPNRWFDAAGDFQCSDVLADTARRIVLASEPALSSAPKYESRSEPSIPEQGESASIAGGLVDVAGNSKNLVITCPDELESNQLGGLRREAAGIYEQLSEDQCAAYAVGAALAGREAWFVSYIGFASYAAPLLIQYCLQAVSRRPTGTPPSVSVILTSLGWSNVFSHRDDSALLSFAALGVGCAFSFPHDGEDVRRFFSESRSGSAIDCVIYDKWERQARVPDDIDRHGTKRWTYGVGSAEQIELSIAMMGNAHSADVHEAAKILSLSGRVEVIAPTQSIPPAVAAREKRVVEGPSLMVSSFSDAVTDALTPILPIAFLSAPGVHALKNVEEAVTADAVRRVSRCRSVDIVAAGRELMAARG